MELLPNLRVLPPPIDVIVVNQHQIISLDPLSRDKAVGRNFALTNGIGNKISIFVGDVPNTAFNHLTVGVAAEESLNHDALTINQHQFEIVSIALKPQNPLWGNSQKENR